VEPFATEFWQWADVLGVDNEDIHYALCFLESTGDLPRDERDAMREALAEIGPAMAAQMVELCPSYLESTSERRAAELLPSVRVARRLRARRDALPRVPDDPRVARARREDLSPVRASMRALQQAPFCLRRAKF
jgi:hypothetical protein